MFAKDDLVTIKGRKDKQVFRIVSIEKNNVLLKGEVIRLLCTSQLDDLEPYLANESDKKISIPAISKDRNFPFIKGRVLHLDGDERYLKKALQAYRQYDVKAVGYFLPESKMPQSITTLIKRHSPEIVVITGHDALYDDKQDKLYDVTNYRNSAYFVDSVKACREISSSLDSLVIIAGACQSYYEALIESGANFASSPNRENIHLFDPVIIASLIASSPVYEYVKVNEILDKTINKNMGGLDTKGQARRVYLGGKTLNDS